MIINSAKDLGTLVRSERKKRGWSQKELADKVGVSPLWISNFERGKSTAQIGLVLRTLKTLGVKLHIGGERPKQPVATATADLNSLIANLHGNKMPQVPGKIDQKPSEKKPDE